MRVWCSGNTTVFQTVIESSSLSIRSEEQLLPRKNKEEHKAYQRMLCEGYRRDMRNLKESLPCTDCGIYFEHFITEWDHVPERGKKKFSIAAMSQAHPISNGSLCEELKKCDLVCANCHKRRTHERRERDKIKPL